MVISINGVSRQKSKTVFFFAFFDCNTLETEEERRKSDMTKEVWEKGEE
jgi:hypothetical protein